MFGLALFISLKSIFGFCTDFENWISVQPNIEIKMQTQMEPNWNRMEQKWDVYPNQ